MKNCGEIDMVSGTVREERKILKNCGKDDMDHSCEHSQGSSLETQKQNGMLQSKVFSSSPSSSNVKIKKINEL